MADPLAAMAEREVPAPTNYFDPAAAQTVISRYASARRRSDSAGEVAEAESKALGRRSDYLRAQDDEDRIARNAVTQSREDEDYQLKKDADLQRGGFLRNMIQMIDPKHPDYNRQVVAFKAGLPPGLVDDKEINSILQSMNSEADDYRSQRNTEVSKEQTRDSQLAVLRERAKLGMSYDVKDDDVKAATREDGSIDEFKLGTIAGANRRAIGANEWDRKHKAVLDGRMKLADRENVSKGARDLLDKAKTYINDPGAFRPQTDVVLEEFRKAKKNPKASKDVMTGEWLDKYEEAKKWDSKPLEREIITAQRYDDPEDYVKLGGENLSENQVAYRKLVHQLSKKDDLMEEDAPQEKGATAAPTKRKWNPETKKLE